MRGRVYPDRSSAEAARAALDAAAGLPRVHVDGEFIIAAPGNAAARLRARGIRTEHTVELIAHPTRSDWAVLGDGTDLPADWLPAAPRRP